MEKNKQIQDEMAERIRKKCIENGIKFVNQKKLGYVEVKIRQNNKEEKKTK